MKLGAVKKHSTYYKVSRSIDWVLFVFTWVSLAVIFAYAAEPEDKEMQILQLQKIIAEQSMNQLLRDELVKEYARIRANYDKLTAEIAEKEKGKKSQ